MVRFASAVCLLMVALVAVPALGQTSGTRPGARDPGTLADKLAEVQQMIDEEESTIALLEKQLNQAVDGQQQEQIDRIRTEIQSAWDRVEKLKELKKSIQNVGSGGPVRPTRPDRPGSRDAFDQDRSTMRGRPTLAVPGLRDPVMPDDTKREPVRMLPDESAGISSPRLRTLESWHAELVETGQNEMAEKVMELIRNEKARLRELVDDRAAGGDRGKTGERPRPSFAIGDQPNNNDPPRDPAPSSRSADGKADNGNRRPAGKDREKELQDLVESMQQELERLREELNDLKEEKSGG